MQDFVLGVLNIHLHLPECASLKEKRGRIKPLLAPPSVQSLGGRGRFQDRGTALICCTMVSSDRRCSAVAQQVTDGGGALDGWGRYRSKWVIDGCRL
jgi:uncharacterized protein YlxP (DUF503 family)